LLALLPAALLTEQTWLWVVADTVVGVLLVLNVLLFVAVHGREVRQRLRGRRAARFEARFGATLAELRAERPDEARLRRQLRGLDRLERPIAARMLADQLRTASAEQRKRIRGVLREIGGIDLIVRSTRRLTPWRRALAIRTLGLVGAEEAVPALIPHLADRSRNVREATVRALGQIGDERAVPALAEVFAKPGSVAPGLPYEALISIGPASAHVFREGLGSPDEYVRVAAVFGVAAVLEPQDSRPPLEAMLSDDAGRVRAATAEMLGRLGGRRVPDELTRAARDEQFSVRRAAVSALGNYDDPQSVQLALNSLDDADRETALRAGETLVRLARRPNLGGAATAAIATNHSWPLETARRLASLEAQ
jgi:HEAT repeat protein